MLLQDMRKQGWTLVKDTSNAKLFLPSQLKLVSLLPEGERYIRGGGLLEEWAKEMGANFGQEQAEYLLRHQQEIQEEWGQFDLLFPGTMWRHHRPYGIRGVSIPLSVRSCPCLHYSDPCLLFSGYRRFRCRLHNLYHSPYDWHLSFDEVTDVEASWNLNRYRLLCPCK